MGASGGLSKSVLSRHEVNGWRTDYEVNSHLSETTFGVDRGKYI